MQFKIIVIIKRSAIPYEDKIFSVKFEHILSSYCNVVLNWGYFSVKSIYQYFAFMHYNGPREILENVLPYRTFCRGIKVDACRLFSITRQVRTSLIKSDMNCWAIQGYVYNVSFGKNC